MVESVNGQRVLPTVVRLPASESGLVPAPGTLRALKAQTGRTFDDMSADIADRFQTLIWARLRHDYPDLLWSECEGIDLLIVNDAPPDPTNGSDSTTSPYSAGSGG